MIFRRGLSGLSRAQLRKREALARLKTAPAPAEAQPASASFSHLLRQLYKKTHPDLLRSKCASSAEHNDKQWQVVNGILSTVKEGGAYPPAISSHISLFMNAPTGRLETVDVRIHTAGGDCQRALTRSFTDLFVAARLFPPGQAPAFAWDPEYFKLAAEGESED